MSKLWCGDCLGLLRKVKDQSVDLIYCDLPYGTTANKWDSVIPFVTMWKQVGRVIKPGCPIVFHAGEPFTSTLIVSRLDWFRYRWTWNKVNRITGYLDAKRRPLRVVEDVVVFSTKGHPTPYNPQMMMGKAYDAGSGKDRGRNYAKHDLARTICDGNRYPVDLLNIPADNRKIEGRNHGTQKPVVSAEYFIKTYSNPGGRVLDFTMGSGTAGIAAARLGRSFIGIEKDPEIFELAQNRIKVAEETGVILSKVNDHSYGFFNK